VGADTGSTRELVVALVLATVAQALVSMAIFAPAVLAPAAQADVGVGASTVGVFISIVFAAAAFAAPLGGAQVVRYGPVRVSQFCLLWAAAGIALFTTASPPLIVCAALAMGFGYGPVTPASSAMLASRSPDRLRNMIMSIRQSGVTLGGVLAGAVLPGLTVAYGWRTSSFVVAAACLICAGVLQTVRERYDTERTDVRHPDHSSYRMLMRVVLKHPELRQVALTSFTYSGVQMCCGSFLVVFLTQRVGMGYIEAGAIYSTAMTGGVIGRMLWGVLADYFGRARIVLGVLGVVMWLSATTMAQVTAQWPYAAVLVVCAVFGISAFGWNGIYIAEVARIAPAGNVALATGAAIVFTFLGIVIVPVLFWLVITLGGTYSAAFMLIGTIALAGGLLFFRKPKVPRAR
jgi:MFS family permease